MIRALLRFIRVCWLMAKARPVVAMPAWDDEDRATLAKFLSSGTGQRFSQAMLAIIAEQNERAVNEGTAAACGRAVGFRLFWAVWEGFSSNDFAERPADGSQYASAGYHGPLADLAHLSP